MMGKVLIKGGTVLSLDRAVGNMVDADVLIEDGSHQRGGYVAAARSAEVVDAADTIVMPGFVDTHRHLWQSLLRNAGTTPPTTGPAENWPATTRQTTSTPPRWRDCSKRSRRASPPWSTGATFPVTPLISRPR